MPTLQGSCALPLVEHLLCLRLLLTVTGSGRVDECDVEVDDEVEEVTDGVRGGRYSGRRSETIIHCDHVRKLLRGERVRLVGSGRTSCDRGITDAKW